MLETVLEALEHMPPEVVWEQVELDRALEDLRLMELLEQVLDSVVLPLVPLETF